MKSESSMITLLGLLLIGISQAYVDEAGEIAHGGHGLKEHGIDTKDHEGTGYGGHKGQVNSKGYDRGFSYGTGYDSGKSIGIGNSEYGGKGFGDKEFRRYGLGGLGYGGLGIRAFRAPFLFYR